MIKRQKEKKKKGPVEKIIQKIKKMNPIRHRATHHKGSATQGNTDGTLNEGRDPPTLPPGALISSFTNITDLNRQNSLRSEYATITATSE